MKKSIIILTILSFAIASHAQESSDFGVYGGMGQRHVETILPEPVLSSMQPAVGLFYRKNYNPRYGLRIGGSYGFNRPYYSVVAAKNLNAYGLMNLMGLTGAIPDILPIDLHAMVDFNFLPLNPRFDTPKVSTFVAAGIGVYQLRPHIPFNVGVKYRVSERFGLSLEWDIRRRILDGVFPPSIGEPESNWFSYIGLTANYNVLKTCKTCPYYESNRKRKR